MEKNKTKIITIASIIALVILIIGATYAYFVAQTGEGSQTDIRINANTVDTLTFETGDPMTLTLDQENFAQGTSNQTGSTFAKAMLTANNKTNTATEHYYMYLNISNNTFTYTQNENTPELLLTITDAGGNAVTDITSLTYKTVTDGKGTSISGYDITNKSGLITLFNNKEITASPTKIDEWNITVTLVNYDKDQSKNAGKNFSAKLVIQKEQIKETVATICSNGQTLSSCIIAMNRKDDTLYYHDGSLENGINDNSYRYAGSSEQVNNFVCFGSTETSCPTDNLYRIIGVIDGKVKLIKYEYATSTLLGTDGAHYGTDTPNKDYYKGSQSSIDTYYWNNATQTTKWSESNLNKINLNTNFINNIGSTWVNKIATTTWKVGGNIENKIVYSVPSVAYQNEIVAPAENATYDAKIGLMYVSDYGFASSPSEWTIALYGYGADNNWMYMGYSEWTISRRTDTYNRIYVSGHVYSSSDTGRGIRPSFSLESSITYVSGSGSMSDPVRIN